MEYHIYDKINYDKINFVTVVQWSRSLARADKPGSTPCDAVFCFFVPFFFPVWSLFLTLFLISFWPFFFILTADLAGHALGSIYILRLSPEFY